MAAYGSNISRSTSNTVVAVGPAIRPSFVTIRFGPRSFRPSGWFPPQ